ncbi:hypothetical protein [Bacillus sp. FJAT-28004]|uniref:hypothetical protein n=1 Tax=Bacillus sp. FJAT-28004 TaxID=1679165 RepID=UPI0006B5ACE0|nr:hypothetical protein [Bacillus sp. FJAT-28004]
MEFLKGILTELKTIEVICLDNLNIEDQLTIRSTYLAVSVPPENNTHFYRVTNDKGSVGVYEQQRFRKV